MSELQKSSKPDENCGRGHSAIVEFFSLWIERLEKFYEERDRRYEDRFKAQDEKTTLALTGSKEAIGKAESATEKRFDAVNEFRGTLSDQAGTLLPRNEAAAKFTSYDEKMAQIQKDIQGLRESRSEIGGRTGGSRESRIRNEWVIGICVIIGIAGVGMMISIAELIIRLWPSVPGK